LVVHFSTPRSVRRTVVAAAVASPQPASASALARVPHSVLLFWAFTARAAARAFSCPPAGLSGLQWCSPLFAVGAQATQAEL